MSSLRHARPWSSLGRQGTTITTIQPASCDRPIGQVESRLLSALHRNADIEFAESRAYAFYAGGNGVLELQSGRPTPASVIKSPSRFGAACFAALSFRSAGRPYSIRVRTDRYDAGQRARGAEGLGRYRTEAAMLGQPVSSLSRT